MTPSARPAIGRVQALDGLYAATGQYTDGVIPGHQPEKGANHSSTTALAAPR